MKRIKLFEDFNEGHKSTGDMSPNEIESTRENLKKSGKFSVYLGKKEQIDSFLKNISPLSKPWVDKKSDTEIIFYETPDADARFEIEDLIEIDNLMKIDLNSEISKNTPLFAYLKKLSESVENFKTDKERLERAKHADLVTFPKEIEGANCKNCQFINMKEKFCTHKDVDQKIDFDMCCSYWNSPGTKREWEK